MKLCWIMLYASKSVLTKKKHSAEHKTRTGDLLDFPCSVRELELYWTFRTLIACANHGVNVMLDQGFSTSSYLRFFVWLRSVS